jgi:hypothetical protein
MTSGLVGAGSARAAYTAPPSHGAGRRTLAWLARASPSAANPGRYAVKA